MATTNLPVRPSKRVRLNALRKGRPNTKISRSSYPEFHKNLTSTSPNQSPSVSKDEKTDITPASCQKGISNSMRVKPTTLPTSFKVVAGSYEKLLYGLDGCVSIDDEMRLQFRLKPIFIFPAHVSCIKAVSTSPNGGKWLATGSSDEIIKVWDLRRRKEIGGLMHHEGSITHLLFPSRSHLLSASEDGSLCLFRARDWAVLKVLRGHKGRVNAVAVHPSGKVALSVGKDKALRMWDLMRGKGVASTKLGKEGETVRWSVDGTKFAVQSGSTIDVYATNMDSLYSITHPSRIHDIKFCSTIDKQSEVLLVGAEDRKVSVYGISKSSQPPFIVAEMVGHTNRIKAVQTIEIALPTESGRSFTTIACTISSDGFINVYDIADIPEFAKSAAEETPTQTLKEIAPLTSYDSKGTRFTCITLTDGDMQIESVENLKRKREEDDHQSRDAEDNSEEEEEQEVESEIEVENESE